MKVTKLKVCKSLLLLAVSGTLSLTITGCKKNNNEYVDNVNTVINNDNKSKAIINTNKEVKPEKIIYKYPKNSYGYVKKNISLKKDGNKDANNIAKITKYEKVKLINKCNGWDYVKYNDKKGYIKDKNIKKILQEFIDVDISEQKLRYYNPDGKIILKSDVVTGTDSIERRRTNVGCFKIEYKTVNATLKGPGYASDVNYWMPFNINEGEGLHDADGWRSAYGGNIYKTNGSHGCVNLPLSTAKKIYEKSEVGTKVLVHK